MKRTVRRDGIAMQQRLQLAPPCDFLHWVEPLGEMEQRFSDAPGNGFQMARDLILRREDCATTDTPGAANKHIGNVHFPMFGGFVPPDPLQSFFGCGTKSAMPRINWQLRPLQIGLSKLEILKLARGGHICEDPLQQFVGPYGSFDPRLVGFWFHRD